MAVKQKLSPQLQKLQDALDKERENEVKALLEKVRGVFIAATDFFNKKRRLVSGKKADIEGIQMSWSQMNKIDRVVSCPCGNCRYYSIEILDDGRYRVHHHTKGQVKSGRWRERKGAWETK